MSGYFDDLERQLHAAARAQVARDGAHLGGSRARAGRWARARAAARGGAAALAVGAAVAIAVLALVFVGHRHGGGPTGRPGGAPPAASGPAGVLHLTGKDRKVIDYVMKAHATAFLRDPGCFAGGGLDHNPARKPSLSQGSPGPALLDILGVLRRPAKASDRLPPRTIGPVGDKHTYPDGTIPPIPGVYVRYVRRARHRFGANYYLVPAQNVNPRRPIPTRCYREEEAALHHELPHIPRALRATALALEPRYVAYERASARPYPGVCLLALNDTGNGDGGCGDGASASQIEQGASLSSGAPAGVPVVYGLAPDGVRSVTFDYAGRRPLTVLVIDNVFILHDVGDRLPRDGFPQRLVWRAANGHVIKTIRRP